MAAVKQPVALQTDRCKEIKEMRERLQGRDQSTINPIIIQSRERTLDRIFDEARSTHTEIIGQDTEETVTYLEDNVFGELMKLHEETSDVLSTLQNDLDRAANEAAAAAAAASAASAASGVPASSSATQDSIAGPHPLISLKLPHLQLPTFSGNYDDWENFRDNFKPLVHDVAGYSETVKLNLLMRCLTDEAKKILQGVTPKKATYQIVWEALNKRFTNPRFVVYSELQRIHKMPYLKEETAQGLRSFTDEAQRIVRVLDNMNMPIKQWNVWIVFILADRLDPVSKKDWETELSAKDLRTPFETDEENPLQRFPTFEEFAHFLETRARALCMLDLNQKDRSKASSSSRPPPGQKRSHHAAFGESKPSGCPMCSKNHKLDQCRKFKAIRTGYDRREKARSLKVCFNCLERHRYKDCTSENVCKHCEEPTRHHSLIHYESRNARPQAPSNNARRPDGQSTQSTAKSEVQTYAARLTSNQPASIILATAQITIIGPNGHRTRARALLDQGSEVTFISDKIASLLRLPKNDTRVSVTGVGESNVGTARFSTQFVLQSLIDPNFKLETEALILQRLTSKLPARRALELDHLSLFADLALADPQFDIPDSIDVILGVEVYGQLLRSGLKRFDSVPLVAQNTALGWVVSGPTRSRRAAQATVRTMHCATDSNLDESLQRFWLTEEVSPPETLLTPDELKCEKLFSDTHTRDSNGRFVVRLPLKSDLPTLAAETRAMARASLSHTHRRFARDSQLEHDFQDFMSKYESLGHMERVPAAEIDNPHAYYLPLHAVVQTNGPTRKLRVVFDAARQTRDKKCLNQFLLPGPALQSDLSLILLNWRRYRFVFTADLVKMFRQISVVPEHRDLLRILWSPSRYVSPIDWRLTTVTYGTNCAPFLAIRTLQQLAEDEKPSFPLGAQCLQHDTYVDDIFSGGDDLDYAISKRNELIGILKSAGIELDKWAANHSDLLPSRSNNDVEAKTIDVDAVVKALGVEWDPYKDQFVFTTLPFEDLVGSSTKRTVLSNISKLFDPLGWLSPVTVTAKILLQDLWILKSGWDEKLPLKNRMEWCNYCRSLSALPSLSIGRWLGTFHDSTPQLHGFCDASSRAYAAAVYLRIVDGSGKVHVSLLVAKTKVAPVKTLSIPHLELCGAALLVKLLCHILKLDFLKGASIFNWSDSQIVLQWLKKHPSHWKTFIANRVSNIQTELPTAVWAHVPTKQNPADLGTRGCTPEELKDNDLWWKGADWLEKSPEHWPRPAEPMQVFHAQPDPLEPGFIRRFSDLTRMTRVIGYCLRPISRLRREKAGLEPFTRQLTPWELDNAKYVVVKYVQSLAYAQEIQLLQADQPLPKRHPLRKLQPFVDKTDGLLRVGGRLADSILTYKRKHPPILPHNSKVSRLFVRHAHKACLHGGPTLTTSILIQRVWIPGSKRLVKTVIRNCVPCQKAHPRLAHQLMGYLPTSRTVPARPFTTTGVDYAGPFQIRAWKGRGHKSYKGYIALFVCFSTRAIHLEVVEDLRSATFIEAYKRFTGRRGICRTLYSDNATTFQGADKELRSMFQAASTFYKEVAESFANQGTNWVFIPPNSPHYGGLWEAGVKSVKHHLKRAIGDRTFTFSELSTILVEIEACLNSRPLCPLKSDTDDLHALTPFTLLIGENSALIPDEEPPDVPENRLDRYHVMQAVRNNFWKRWSGEYLQHLQERAKWRSPAVNFAVGQLVIVRDDNLPPSRWPLGRVTKVYPGRDGLVRVVDVRTASSTLRRHIVRLCPLSMEPEQQN